MIIYKTTNIKNNKSYIGQTMALLSTRKSQHNHIAMKTKAKTAIHRAIRKYGIENFKWNILCECDTINELNEMEKYYIKEYGTFSKYGYNMTSGGKNYIVSRKARKNMSEAKSGKNHPNYGKHHLEEIRKKMSKSAVGKKKSKEHKEKLRIAQTGRKYSEETKQKLSEMKMGHFVSVETRKKIGDVHKGKVVSDETRNKMRLAQTGSHHTEETKQKISKAFSGIKWHLVVCPHCGKEGGVNIMHRWHFDNCRSKKW